jgi:hypothetical protein
VKKLGALTRVGGAIVELLSSSVAVASRYGRRERAQGGDSKIVALLPLRRRRKNNPDLEATPIYTDKWSIQNEVHP